MNDQAESVAELVRGIEARMKRQRAELAKTVGQWEGAKALLVSVTQGELPLAHNDKKTPKA